MIRWIARLVRMFETERVMWRDRREPVTLEFINGAAREAIARFPEDRLRLEAKAISELSLRELQGRRRLDG